MPNSPHVSSAQLPASALNSAYATYSFSKSFAQKIKESQTSVASTAAKTLGLHAENVIVNALDRLPEAKRTKNKTPPPNPTATLQILAAGKEGERINSIVDRAAVEAARQIKAILDKELQDLPDNKKYQLDLKGLSGSSPVGDIGIIVNNKRIIFEAKYQKTSTKNTRWFGLASQSLFGDDSFKEHLAAKNLLMHKLESSPWIDAVQGELADYLEKNIGGPQKQIQTLIKKGKAIPENSFDAKYVVHMMGQISKIDVTITSMEQLQEKLKRVSHTGKSQFHSQAALGKVNSIDYLNAENDVVAQLGVVSKSKEDYKLEFYIAQKLINANAF